MVRTGMRPEARTRRGTLGDGRAVASDNRRDLIDGDGTCCDRPEREQPFDRERVAAIVRGEF